MEVGKNRFIPYNMTDMKSSFCHERLHHVKTKVLKILGALSLGAIIIAQCFTLGTWKDHAVSSIPLFVIFENCEVRDRILRSAGKLWSLSSSNVWLKDVFI